MSEIDPNAVGSSEPPQATGKPADVKGRTVGIKKCDSCDGAHEGVAMQAFVRQNSPFTHWFTCPVTGDAVPVSLVGLTSGDAINLESRVLQRFVEAQISGRYVVLVSFVNAEGKLMFNCINNHLPHGDYFGEPGRKGLFDLIRDAFENIVGPQQPKEMKQASPVPVSAGVIPGLEPNINHLPG